MLSSRPTSYFNGALGARICIFLLAHAACGLRPDGGPDLIDTQENDVPLYGISVSPSGHQDSRDRSAQRGQSAEKPLEKNYSEALESFRTALLQEEPPADGFSSSLLEAQLSVSPCERCIVIAAATAFRRPDSKNTNATVAEMWEEFKVVEKSKTAESAEKTTLRIIKPDGDERQSDKPGGDKPGGDKPGGDEPGGDKPGGDKPDGDKRQGRDVAEENEFVRSWPKPFWQPGPGEGEDGSCLGREDCKGGEWVVDGLIVAVLHGFCGDGKHDMYFNEKDKVRIEAEWAPGSPTEYIDVPISDIRATSRKIEPDHLGVSAAQIRLGKDAFVIILFTQFMSVSAPASDPKQGSDAQFMCDDAKPTMAKRIIDMLTPAKHEAPPEEAPAPPKSEACGYAFAWLPFLIGLLPLCMVEFSRSG